MICVKSMCWKDKVLRMRKRAVYLCLLFVKPVSGR